MRKFYGCTFVNKEMLKEAGINHPIKFEYYKIINEDYTNFRNGARYGIYIVKTEYIEDKVKVESKNIKYITNDEKEEDKILNIFKENQVSIINAEDVILDLIKEKFVVKQ